MFFNKIVAWERLLQSSHKGTINPRKIKIDEDHAEKIGKATIQVLLHSASYNQHLHSNEQHVE